VRAPVKLILASSNPGKLEEFRVLARTQQGAAAVEINLLPDFSTFPSFEENAPTFAENAAGKALHYSQFCEGLIFADDSGLCVPALGGAPGVQSARYAGPHATSSERILAKLLAALREKEGAGRAAYFVCTIALAQNSRILAVVSDRVDGEILYSPKGSVGFGYDPVFYFPPLAKSFAEVSREEKNLHSHRGKAFRRLLAAIRSGMSHRSETNERLSRA
jgi:XTP/dITP diphosphohydrolase